MPIRDIELRKATKPIPEGYHTVTPYVAVDDAADGIEYYKKAFGGKERMRPPEELEERGKAAMAAMAEMGSI